MEKPSIYVHKSSHFIGRVGRCEITTSVSEKLGPTTFIYYETLDLHGVDPCTENKVYVLDKLVKQTSIVETMLADIVAETACNTDKCLDLVSKPVNLEIRACGAGACRLDVLPGRLYITCDTYVHDNHVRIRVVAYTDAKNEYRNRLEFTYTMAYDEFERTVVTEADLWHLADKHLQFMQEKLKYWTNYIQIQI